MKNLSDQRGLTKSGSDPHPSDGVSTVKMETTVIYSMKRWDVPTVSTGEKLPPMREGHKTLTNKVNRSKEYSTTIKAKETHRDEVLSSSLSLSPSPLILTSRLLFPPFLTHLPPISQNPAPERISPNLHPNSTSRTTPGCRSLGIPHKTPHSTQPPSLGHRSHPPMNSIICVLPMINQPTSRNSGGDAPGRIDKTQYQGPSANLLPVVLINLVTKL